MTEYLRENPVDPRVALKNEQAAEIASQKEKHAIALDAVDGLIRQRSVFKELEADRRYHTYFIMRERGIPDSSVVNEYLRAHQLGDLHGRLVFKESELSDDQKQIWHAAQQMRVLLGLNEKILNGDTGHAAGFLLDLSLTDQGAAEQCVKAVKNLIGI